MCITSTVITHQLENVNDLFYYGFISLQEILFLFSKFNDCKYWKSHIHHPIKYNQTNSIS
jgi:hypothetical protein